MVTLFTRLDRDENGYLSNRDIKIFANSFSKFGVLTEREEARKCKNLLQFWEKIMGDKERIELEDYIKARIPLVRRQKNGKGNNNNTIISNNNNNNNGPVDKQIDIGADIMFDSIDTNGNGTISVREFNTFFKCIFIHDDDYAQEIFSRVNTNGEGQMSREEFGYAFRDFMLNEEESPFKELFGPLLPL